MSADQETLAVYDLKAEEYANLTATEAEVKSLTAFVKDLPKNARVLDLGCGPGANAADMARLGCRVDAVDASAEMVARAVKLDGVTAWQGFFEDLDVEAVYDGVWANFSLLHAPKFDMPAHLDRIRRALKPQGIFHIGMKLGSGEKRDRIGRRYSYYEEGELAGLLNAAGFEVIDTATGESRGLDGSVAAWITMRARLSCSKEETS